MQAKDDSGRPRSFCMIYNLEIVFYICSCVVNDIVQKLCLQRDGGFIQYARLGTYRPRTIILRLKHKYVKRR